MTSRRVPLKHRIFVLAAVVLLGGVVFFLHQTQANSAPTDVAGRDAKRISDLNLIRGELDLYFNECGYYPGAPHVKPPCGPYVANNTWIGLSAALVGNSLHIASLPNDPMVGANYFYSAAPHGTGFVIGATLEDPTNPILTQSVHGVINSMNCDTSTYCVQL